MTVVIIFMFLVENRPCLSPDFVRLHIIPRITDYTYRYACSHIDSMHIFYACSNTSDIIDAPSQIGENHQIVTTHPWKYSTMVEKN